MMATETFTSEEANFLSRMASKMVAGLSFDDAAQAVREDDRRIVQTYERMDSYDRAFFEQTISHQVFAGIHARLSGLNAQYPPPVQPNRSEDF